MHFKDNQNQYYMRKTLLNCAFMMLFIASTQAITLTDNAGLILTMGSTGTISGVSLNKTTLTPVGIGGFYSQSPNSTTKVAFTGTAITTGTSTQLKLTNSLQDSVTAVITQGVGYIEINGVIKDLTGTDRGLWLGFNLPINTTNWKWGQSLSLSPTISSTAPGYSGDNRLLVPIPAVWNTNGGIAMCIPPTNPCVFELSADASGLRVQMAFGLSPITAKFPSKAPFRFRIYTIDGTWGFRDALAKYYDWYPDYYGIAPSAMKRLNYNRDWLTMNYESTVPSTNDMTSIAFPAMKEYCAYTKLTARPQGMTGVETLLPTDTQGYINAIANCTDIMHYGRKVPTTDASLVEARAAISKCAVYHPDSSWSMQMAPALGTLDIGHNVSPYLYKDAAHPNTPIYGDMYLRRPANLLKYNPNFTSMHWDLTGARSLIANYRREHFAYTQNPLTFDQLGRLCLPTQFTNYELMDAFRLTKPGNMYHEAAGMEDFNAKTATELLGGQDRVSIFFLSSVLASAWNEGGEKPKALGDYDFYRIFMGRKSYRIAWGPPITAFDTLANVKGALADATAFGFACCPDPPYFYSTTHPSYAPASYMGCNGRINQKEHTDLWNSYIPASEAIRLAGWEPVTYATTTSNLVELQRFGRRDSIYITAWGPTPPATLDIEIDSIGMGFKAKPAFSEMVSNTAITVSKSAKGWILRLSMEKNMTRVIRMVPAKSTDIETNTSDLVKFEVYPNPSCKIINIKCEHVNELQYSYRITNALNQELYTSKLQSDKTTIDISNFASKGIYFVQIIDEKGTCQATKKLIVQ